MSYRPAGMSDEDDDEFEFSTEIESDYDFRKRMRQEEKVESKEDIFYTALKDRNIGLVKTMLSDGFSVDQPLVGGWSPLMHACSLGSLTVIEFLIGLQANVNFNKELFTCLMALCKSSSNDEDELLKCVNKLINQGANINATDRNACTALMYACSSGHVELVRKLVESGCDVNIQDTEGWSALFHAVSEGREDIIRILVEGKARLDLIDRRRRSAFNLALQKGYDHLGKLVCSKKEKRKLFEEEKNFYIPEKNINDPVEELFAQLPSINAKNISGFASDVSKLLQAMGLSHFSKQFAVNKVQLNEFLLITDERLKELGVRFSIHRQRILNSIRKLHVHRWNKTSLGMKPRNQQMDVEDGIRLMCNVVKHLHILNATMNYSRIYQPIPIKPDVFRMCETTLHQLNLISGELHAINSFSGCLNLKEKVEPVDLLKPRKQSQNYYISILTTVFVCLVLWKRKISLPFIKLPFYDAN